MSDETRVRPALEQIKGTKPGQNTLPTGIPCTHHEQIDECFTFTYVRNFSLRLENAPNTTATICFVIDSILAPGWLREGAATRAG